MIRKALANLVVKHLCLILLFLGANQDMCLGASFDGTQTYLRYLIVLVHGIGGNFANWTDKKYDEIKNININDLSSYNKYGGFKKHLEKPVSEGGLGLKGYVYAYTFSSPCGAAKDNAKELGDRTYNNPTPGMSGQCWLEKAQNDFIDNFKRDVGRAPLPSETPEKYILIVHSMGNYAARGYIYSEQLRDFFDEGFYAYDVDKVIFVDAVLNGSTMTYIPYMTAYAKGTFLSDRFNELLKNGLPTFDWQFVKKRSFLENFANIYEMSKDKIFEMFTPYIKDQLLGGDIFGPYQFAGDFSGVVIMAPQFYSSLGGLRAPNEAWKGLPDLFPSEIGRTTRVLNKVKSLGIEDEPSYSIVYSSGMPVFEPYSSGVIMLSKSLKDNGLVDFNNKYVNDFLGLNYQKMTFVHPSFYSLPTAQSKFMSLLMARYGVGFFTNDGDGAVNVQSQKGEGIAVLSSAPRYQKVFKSDGFENYLNNDFATQVFIVEGAMVGTAALMAAGGTPYIIAWQNLWPMRLIPAASLITNVYAYKDEINSCVEAHRQILSENELLSKALLDSVAIFTVNDLQTTLEATTSEEGSAFLSFSISSPEAGYRSIKARAVQENRVYAGNVSMPVPTTLDNNRKYMMAVTVTEAPQRVAGKLNYLVPALMRSFEYSFNFAAWKPVANVDPKTGEFYLDGLPFAEGQNVLAVRSENAVGVKANQLCKIILNTIPMVPSNLLPLPGMYTNNNQIEISFVFAKAAREGFKAPRHLGIKSHC